MKNKMKIRNKSYNIHKKFLSNEYILVNEYYENAIYYLIKDFGSINIIMKITEKSVGYSNESLYFKSRKDINDFVEHLQSIVPHPIKRFEIENLVFE